MSNHIFILTKVLISKVHFFVGDYLLVLDHSTLMAFVVVVEDLYNLDNLDFAFVVDQLEDSLMEVFGRLVEEDNFDNELVGYSCLVDIDQADYHKVLN